LLRAGNAPFVASVLPREFVAENARTVVEPTLTEAVGTSSSGSARTSIRLEPAPAEDAVTGPGDKPWLAVNPGGASQVVFLMAGCRVPTPSSSPATHPHRLDH
jgi:hypothetical protein